jgi:hypothetical protein
MVDTPIVEGTEDRLGADLSAWCDSFCVKAAECDVDKVDGACVSDCVGYFLTNFANRGDTCSQAGLRVMDCYDQASCADLNGPDTCNILDEEALCAGAPGPVVCDAVDNSVGVNGAPFECARGLSDCSDGRVYSLECSGPGDPPDCHCLVDGQSTGRFSPSRLECPSDLEAIQICGWPIVRAENPDAPPPPTIGVIGGSSPSNGVECSIEYTECSDGHNYVVACDGSAGAVVCECSIDGAPEGSYLSPNGICPYEFDPFGAVVAANYACGFNIAPVTPN